jgi:hypothetical protein
MSAHLAEEAFEQWMASRGFELSGIDDGLWRTPADDFVWMGNALIVQLRKVFEAEPEQLPLMLVTVGESCSAAGVMPHHSYLVREALAAHLKNG